MVPVNFQRVRLAQQSRKLGLSTSRIQHKHNEWLQILAQEDFPPKLLWSENADFKFSVNNEGEDVNKRPRSRRNIDEHSEGNGDNNRQRNRRLESKEL